MQQRLYSYLGLAFQHLLDYHLVKVSLNTFERTSEVIFVTLVGKALWNKKSESGPCCIQVR